MRKGIFILLIVFLVSFIGVSGADLGDPCTWNEQCMVGSYCRLGEGGGYGKICCDSSCEYCHSDGQGCCTPADYGSYECGNNLPNGCGYYVDIGTCSSPLSCDRIEGQCVSSCSTGYFCDGNEKYEQYVNCLSGSPVTCSFFTQTGGWYCITQNTRAIPGNKGYCLGAGCHTQQDYIKTESCPSGQVCYDGECMECVGDGDCEPGYECSGNVCVILSCSGSTPCGTSPNCYAKNTYYRDYDGDGKGNLGVTEETCNSQPSTGYVSNSADCDDANQYKYGGNSNTYCDCAPSSESYSEVCDSVDNDCDGLIDEDEVCLSGACTSGDSEEEPCGTDVGWCVAGTKTRTCVDSQWGSWGSCVGEIGPSVEECNGVDDDCDGLIDEEPDSLCGTGETCQYGVCIPPASNCNANSYDSECGYVENCKDIFQVSTAHVEGGWACGSDTQTDYCVDINTVREYYVDCLLCDEIKYEDISCGSGKECSGGSCVDSSCDTSGTDCSNMCSGYWCSDGNVCQNKWKWDSGLQECKRASFCGETCPYDIETDWWNYVTTPGCFFGTRPNKQSCCNVNYGEPTTDWCDIIEFG